MKIMHKPIGVRSKIEELLKKEGKELVNLAYGTADENETHSYVGITYIPGNDNEESSYSSNRYDVFVYDNETDNFEYCSICLKYENALIQMGQMIRKATYENK